jgi:hypothetical protein
MALVRCADCGKERSEQAPACPYCGRPNPEGCAAAAAGAVSSDSGTRRIGFVLLVAILGLAFIAMVGRTNNSSAKATAPVGPSDAALRIDAEMSVKPMLRGPGSARFRNVVVVRQDSSTTVCGEVNGKNGFGGYFGYTPFVAIGNLVQMPTKRDDGFHTLWRAVCARKGEMGSGA